MTLSLRNRLLIFLHLDPKGRRRPTVPSTAHYESTSLFGRVDTVAPYSWQDEDTLRIGTEIGVSSAGGIVRAKVRQPDVAVEPGQLVELFAARTINEEIYHPVFILYRETSTMMELPDEIRLCARRNGSEEDWSLELLRREARWFAYEHSGVAA